MSAPSTLATIRNKIRRITGRPSNTSITDAQIDESVNTFYVFDFPEHLRLQNLRVNYQFLTSANIPVYDFPTDLFLTIMPPIFIAGYQSYMTQSRENFFRLNPALNYLQQSVATGTGVISTYTFNLANGNILRGFKRNPPGAYSDYTAYALPAAPFKTNTLNWNVMFSGLDALGNSVSLVDDGLGNLWLPNEDIAWDAGLAQTIPLPRGSINYITGAVSITFPTAIGLGNPISAQYVPFVPARPMSACFFQDQISIYPIPNSAYTVSFEAYKYPTALLQSGESPQLAEWWQALAYGGADKIFTDNGDMENAAKYRPLLDEQLRLIMRRTIVQQTSERTSTIYTEQTSPMAQFPFGNNFGF
jgi:hypothetical protein